MASVGSPGARGAEAAVVEMGGAEAGRAGGTGPVGAAVAADRRDRLVTFSLPVAGFDGKGALSLCVFSVAEDVSPAMDGICGASLHTGVSADCGRNVQGFRVRKMACQH